MGSENTILYFQWVSGDTLERAVGCFAGGQTHCSTDRARPSSAVCEKEIPHNSTRCWHCAHGSAACKMVVESHKDSCSRFRTRGTMKHSYGESMAHMLHAVTYLSSQLRSATLSRAKWFVEHSLVDFAAVGCCGAVWNMDENVESASFGRC